MNLKVMAVKKQLLINNFQAKLNKVSDEWDKRLQSKISLNH